MSTEVVYITGASGFIGQHLQRLLPVMGVRRIVTVGRSGSNLDYPAFATTELAAGSAVIHLAGQAHDLRGDSNEAAYERANVALTRDVYEAFRASKAEVFIFLSSVKAVRDAPVGILRQGDAPNPTTPYGRSKLRAEQYLGARPASANQRVYVLRPCVVVGPGVKGNLALLDRFVQSGIPYPFGAFSNERSILSIQNLAHIVDVALDGALPPGTYNLADDEPLSTTEIVRTFARARGLAPRIWRVPMPLVKAISGLGDTLPIPLNSERLEKLTESYVVDNSAVLRALGRKSMPITAREGIQGTVSPL